MERVFWNPFTKSFLQCSSSSVYMKPISTWPVYLHLPSVCSRTFFGTWISHKTTCKTPQLVMESLQTSDRARDLLETTYVGHGRNWFPLLRMCVFGPVLKEKKKKTNFMKLVHWAFMICSLSANGKTPTGPLSSHITHKNTYICTGSCHTVSGVCQRFASAQTSQIFGRTGSFRFSVVRRQ